MNCQEQNRLRKWVLAAILLFIYTPCGNPNECMTLVSPDGPCSFPINDHDPQIKRKGLVKCMDKCLASSLSCIGIQWDTQHGLCYEYNEPEPPQRHRGCLVFRRGCQTPSDIVCMKTVFIHKFRPGIRILEVEEEMNCRILCTMWESCLGVTWYAQKDACEVHEERQTRTTAKTDYRDIMAVKDLKCSARCLTLTMNIGAWENRSTPVSSLSRCVGLLNNINFMAVVWKVSQQRCYVQLSSSDSVVSGESNTVRIQQSKTCQESDVCYRKKEGVMVDGGFILGAQIPEEECLSFCRRVRNCAVVTYSPPSQICILLTIVKNRRRQPVHLVYEITSCSDSDSYRSTYFLKNENMVKNEQREGKRVIQIGSDVKTGSDVGEKEDVNVLGCAVQCALQKNCQALKHNAKGQTKRCTLNPKSEPSFIKLV